MDFAALKKLIEATPDAASRYEIGDDTGCAAILNVRTQRGPVPLVEVSSFALQTGLMGAVQALDSLPVGTVIDQQSGVTVTLQIKGLLRSVISMIQDTSRLTVGHLDDADGTAMLDGLQSLGVLTADNRAALLSLADNRLSLAELQLGSLVDAATVAVTRGI